MAAAAAGVASSFVPRMSFANALSANLPRSYYLGHHQAGLRDITKRLSNIGLVLECRDYRVPISSWNPLLDRAIAGRDRIVVYTHRDLGTDSPSLERTLRRHNAGKTLEGGDRGEAGYGGGKHRSVFWRKDDPDSTKNLLSEIRDIAAAADSLTGVRALVVGMPNVGKSTLLNRLRAHGMHKKTKVARVGAQPGVTRKISSPVRILGGADSEGHQGDPDDLRGGSLGEGVYVLDTPGVFMPYVQDAEDMVKLALAGSVKDDRIPMEILADYLLYRLNLVDATSYGKYSEPTNEVNDFLEGVARKTGKLKSGGVANLEAAADWVVKQWRVGNLGKFVLDEVSEDVFKAKELAREGGGPLSLSQARKREKELKKERSLKKTRTI